MVDMSSPELHSGTEDAMPEMLSVEVHSGTEEVAVSWAAIVAGGVASAALTLVLLAFGAGIGLSAVSPWANSGISSTTFNFGAGVYLCIIAVMASSIGGYLAGRLRTKWVGVHTHEVYFRDTVHGFLAWAFATVLSVAVLASRRRISLAARRWALPKRSDPPEVNRLGRWPASWICCCAQFPL